MPTGQDVQPAEPSAAYAPDWQAAQDSALYPAECVPAGQGAQLRLAPALRKLPGAHAGVGDGVGVAVGVSVGAAVGIAAHAVWPCAPPVHCPAAQPWHMLCPHWSWYAAISWYLPDGQCSQFVLPVHALYFPVAHAWHVPPAEGWNRPSAQSVHSTEPAAAYCPLAHAVQAAAL